MNSEEETAGLETALTSAPQSAVPNDARCDANAILHREIEALLPNLRRYARQLTRDTADADDLVQECAARALIKLHLWKPGTDLRAWLFRILHNLHVSQLRRATREVTTVDLNEFAPNLSCGPDQIEHLEFRELERAIMSLPKQQRIAVLLIGLTPGNYYEVASACGVPVGTLRSRLARGRQNLRELRGIAPPQLHISAPCEVSAKWSVAPNPAYLACDAPTLG